MQVGDALIVEVLEAAAGSGMVLVDQGGEVVAGMGGYEITVTYTAIGQIGEGKQITVVVPDGWSPPQNAAAADEQLGTYTVAHLLKLADDDADGERDDGSAVEAGDPVKADGAAEDAEAMIMVATLAGTVNAGDSVVFTYSNATAPAAVGGFYFTTEYDGEEVEGNVKVIVESGKEASMLAVEADNFIMDDDGSTTVTVKLLDPDGELATRSTDTTVNLSAPSGTIASSVTIEAGSYYAETTLTAAEAANITITATATATDLTDAEPVTVLADTNSPSIDADSITAEPMYAKEGIDGNGFSDGNESSSS